MSKNKHHQSLNLHIEHVLPSSLQQCDNLALNKLFNGIRARNIVLSEQVSRKGVQKRLSRRLNQNIFENSIARENALVQLKNEYQQVKLETRYHKDETVVLKHMIRVVCDDISVRKAQTNVCQIMKADLVNKNVQTKNIYNATKANYIAFIQHKKENPLLRAAENSRKMYALLRNDKEKNERTIKIGLTELKRISAKISQLTEENDKLLEEKQKLDAVNGGIVTSFKELKDKYNDISILFTIITVNCVLISNTDTYLSNPYMCQELLQNVSHNPQKFLYNLVTNRDVIESIDQYIRKTNVKSKSKFKNFQFERKTLQVFAPPSAEKRFSITINVPNLNIVNSSNDRRRERHSLAIVKEFRNTERPQMQRANIFEQTLELGSSEGEARGSIFKIRTHSITNKQKRASSVFRSIQINKPTEFLLEFIKNNIDVNEFTNRVLGHVYSVKRHIEMRTREYKDGIVQKDLRNNEFNELRISARYCRELYKAQKIELLNNSTLNINSSLLTIEDKHRHSSMDKRSLLDPRHIFIKSHSRSNSYIKSFVSKPELCSISRDQEEQQEITPDMSKLAYIQNVCAEIKIKDDYVNNTNIELLTNYRSIVQQTNLQHKNVITSCKVISLACIRFIHFVENIRGRFKPLIEKIPAKYMLANITDFYNDTKFVEFKRKAIKDSMPYVCMKFMRMLLKRMNGSSLVYIFTLIASNQNASLLTAEEKMMPQLIDYVANGVPLNDSLIETEYGTVFKASHGGQHRHVASLLNHKFAHIFAYISSFMFRNNAKQFDKFTSLLTQLFCVRPNETESCLPAKKYKRSNIRKITLGALSPKTSRKQNISRQKRNGIILDQDEAKDKIKMLNFSINPPNFMTNRKPKVSEFNIEVDKGSYGVGDSEKISVEKFYKEYKGLNARIRYISVRSKSPKIKNGLVAKKLNECESFAFDSNSTKAAFETRNSSIKVKSFFLKSKVSPK